MVELKLLAFHCQNEKRGKTVEKWKEICKEESTAAQRGAMRGTEAQAGGGGSGNHMQVI